MTLDANSNEPFYVLDDSRTPVEATKAEWEASVGDGVIVAKTELENGGTVTTYFLGVGDTAGEYFGSEYDPEERLLFVTHSQFGDESHEEDGYPSWGQAEAGHQAIVDRYKKLFG